MTSTDPLAAERFRTLLTDAADAVIYGGSDIADQVDPSTVSDRIIDDFPDAHFEYRTNEAGVRVRRVVVASSWEVDPMSGEHLGGGWHVALQECDFPGCPLPVDETSVDPHDHAADIGG